MTRFRFVPRSWIRSAAEQGFGPAKTAAYERGRPTYDGAVVQSLLRMSGLLDKSSKHQLKVVELGAGTGKFSRVLDKQLRAAHGEENTQRWQYRAVEPVEAMREEFKRASPALADSIIAGSARNIPAAADSLDAVFAAQAFHWYVVLAAGNPSKSLASMPQVR